MAVTRLAPNQFQTDLPLDAVREAVWHVFNAEGYANAVIDASQNIVVGFNKSNLLSTGDAAKATFSMGGNGTIVTINARPSIPGAVDFGKSKRKATNMVDRLLTLLSSGAPSAIGPGDQVSLQKAAPIADPSAAPSATRPTGVPFYGHAGPVPVGTHILINSIVFICICQVLSIFNVISAIKTLKDYGQDDPGDKTLVIIGLVISSLMSLVFVAYVALIFVVGVMSGR